MEKYKITKKLGDGTFGSVSQAKHNQNGEIYAIKKLKEKFFNWQNCLDLPEIKALLKLNHPNIVKLYEVIKQKNELYMVFEYLDQNIYQLLKDRRRPQGEIEIRNIMFQTLQGIYYIHKIGYFHRDQKPENLQEFKGTIKIADFGLAKETNFKPPFTDYVSTRWYRAPELILGSTNYGPGIDIFACAVIMAELYQHYPQFPGKNENDQMQKICAILGSPSINEWPEGYKLASKANFEFPKSKPKPLGSILKNASRDCIDLLEKMLLFDQTKRITAVDCLLHPYFQVSLPMSIDPADVQNQTSNTVSSNPNNNMRSNQNINYPEVSNRENSQDSRKIDLDCNLTRGGNEELSREPAKDRQFKSTGYYQKKARYRPGVNLSQLQTNAH